MPPGCSKTTFPDVSPHAQKMIPIHYEVTISSRISEHVSCLPAQQSTFYATKTTTWLWNGQNTINKQWPGPIPKSLAPSTPEQWLCYDVAKPLELTCVMFHSLLISATGSVAREQPHPMRATLFRPEMICSRKVRWASYLLHCMLGYIKLCRTHSSTHPSLQNSCVQSFSYQP